MYLILILAAVAATSSSSDRALQTWLNVGYGVSLLGTIISFGLTSYSVFVVHSLCYWCLASAILVTLTFSSYALISALKVSAPIFRDSRILLYVGFLLLACFSGTAGAAIYLNNTAASNQISPFALAEAQRDEFVTPSNHVLGPKGARYTLVFFGDLECPLCHVWFPKAKEITRKHGAQLVFRHFPLPIHPYAARAAVLSERAAISGHFWEFLDEACGEEVDDDALEHLAQHFVTSKEAAKDIEYARQCVRQDVLFARKLQLSHTPTMLLLDKGSPTRSVSLLGLEEALGH